MGFLDQPQPTACKSCGQTGGKFRLVGKDWLCPKCTDGSGVLKNAGKNLWDFTTSNFNGQPIHVKSGRHLDQLCKQFGVSNFARENYTRNW
jgi:rubredoxin